MGNERQMLAGQEISRNKETDCICFEKLNMRKSREKLGGTCRIRIRGELIRFVD